MTQFLETLCRTCGSCLKLITLDPGPEQCDECEAEEAKELQREREEEEQRLRVKEEELRIEHQNRLKREAGKLLLVSIQLKSWNLTQLFFSLE